MGLSKMSCRPANYKPIDYPVVPPPQYWIAGFNPDPPTTQTLIVNKRKYRVIFTDETEEAVTIVLEPKG